MEDDDVQHLHRSPMKRNSEMASTGRGQKRVRSDEPHIRLLIPSKVAGSIIGKGGKNISRLRSEYEAVVQVPDCPGPERVVTISAEYETAIKIVGEILPSLKEFFMRTGEVDVRILVHQSLAGCVIGKGGSKVKELREKTNAKIKIFSSCCPQSTDRVISIVGSPEVCLDGLREIIEVLKATPPKGFAENYDPQNYEEDYAEEYGGFGVPGPRGPVWESRPYPTGTGGPPPPPPPRDILPPPPPPPRGAMRMGPFMRDDPDRSMTQVTIPKDMAGAIIGKGGNKIRKIRATSGAEITIDEPTAGSDDRIITIKGNPDQTQMAQYLLQQSVRESQATY